MAPPYASVDRALQRRTLAGILKALVTHSSMGQPSVGWRLGRGTRRANCRGWLLAERNDGPGRPGCPSDPRSLTPRGAADGDGLASESGIIGTAGRGFRGALAETLARGAAPSDAFAAIVDRIPDLVALVSPAGEIVYVNASGRQRLGRDDRTPWASIAELHTPPTAVRILDEALPHALEHGHWCGNGQLRCAATRPWKSKSPCRAHGHVYPGETLLAVIERDVHERKRAAESEAWKNAILESSLDPIISVNHLGVITDFNAAAERVFGHPRSHVISKKPEDVLFPAEDEGQKRIDRNLSASAARCWGCATRCRPCGPTEKCSRRKWR